MNKKIISSILLIFLVGLLFSNPLLGSKDEKLPDAPRKGGKPLQVLVDWQRDLRETISSFFNKIDGEKGFLFLLGLLGFSFLYGIIHSAGPGHRKTVIFSLFLGRDSKWWEPITAGFLSAGLHGMSGMILILVLYGISKAMLSSRMNKLTLYFEGITYIILFIVALVLFVLKLLEFIGKRHHHHSSNKSSKGLYSTIAAASFFPCPGAVMILIFALALGKFFVGFLSILCLSIGMGITISLTGFLALTGRKGLFLALKNQEHKVEKIASIMEILAYLFLILYSLWSVLPFVVSII